MTDEAVKQVLTEHEQKVVARLPLEMTWEDAAEMRAIVFRLAKQLAASRASQWAKCSERLPEDGEMVLWGNSESRLRAVGDVRKHNGRIDHEDGGHTHISDWTHWREIPTAPSPASSA